MRIGIVPRIARSFGSGTHHYNITMLRALSEWKTRGCEDEFVVFLQDIRNPQIDFLREKGWPIKPLQPPTLNKRVLDGLRSFMGNGPHRRALRKIRKKTQLFFKNLNTVYLPNPDKINFRPDLRCWFIKNGIELMIYPSWNALSFETGIPSIMTIYDVQHRLQPHFPEVSMNGEWEQREYIIRNAARYVTLIIADSEVGKEDILNFYSPYGITSDRIKVLPYLPAYIPDDKLSKTELKQVREIFHLPQNYLFYPAQFWPHKNHLRLIKALGILKATHGYKIPLVLCGSHNDSIRQKVFQEVISHAHRLGVEGQLFYLNWVPDKYMPGLYAGALALVMPTFFGPTNIPILEAWAFGCPVLTSDIWGLREQVGDAGILVDPFSEEAIAYGINRLLNEEDLRKALVERGMARLNSYTFEDYLKRLIEIINEAKERVKGNLCYKR